MVPKFDIPALTYLPCRVLQPKWKRDRLRKSLKRMLSKEIPRLVEVKFRLLCRALSSVAADTHFKHRGATAVTEALEPPEAASRQNTCHAVVCAALRNFYCRCDGAENSL